MNNEIQKQTFALGHFSSPEEAVPIITKLLVKEDFKTLASYYDLSDSGVKLVDLESGDFFIRKKRPEVTHPGDFWRFKHPFSLGFKYSSMSNGPKENIYTIHVEIIIEQGTDSPSQVGVDSFYMIKSNKGWRILPSRVEEVKILNAPEPFPAPAPSWE